ncbi:hypothetical protein GCK72_022641 [Caenorhabditis remanei]|uniref:C2H2-type domain-containing protein n=1 Tax=Caenorhabditis remanei TaxID=31234 RepID=A0A6A5FU93_CAERE|nr:hypothetical protein GCK72_022641 [Caenorhabditis remanei]KAF1746188.1 hypothetical protein GCK72_022641 [Caenorhabditis remanei]
MEIKVNSLVPVTETTPPPTFLSTSTQTTQPPNCPFISSSFPDIIAVSIEVIFFEAPPPWHRATPGLKQHMQALAKKKQFQCEICLRRFRFETNLHEHKSVHKDKVFECLFPKCTQTCRLKGNLKKHMRVHYNSVEGWDEEYKKFTSSLKKPKKQQKRNGSTNGELH